MSVAGAARGLLAAGMIATALAACTTSPPRRDAAPAPGPAAAPGPGTAPAARTPYYLDDGPGAAPPADLDGVPDAIPRVETLHRFANRPYVVFGREYVPATTLRPYRERGIASWYGRKFHGERTSTGEVYDMYAMTAAHPTLPLPSYARVSNPATGKSVIVRVNDRGPFLHGRLIDLSYAAAHRLGIAQRGSGEVEVEAILPVEAVRAAGPPLPTLAATTPPAPVETMPITATAESGYAVQLGAFANQPNALAFVRHLANQLPAVGVEPRIRQVGSLFRVFVGPFATRDDAKRMADRLREDIGLDSTIAAH